MTPAPVVTDELTQPPFIPPPRITPNPDVKLAPIAPLERTRLRAAAFQATRVYPGPVGELISIELMAWDEFGYRLGSRTRVMALVEHIETTATTVQPAG